MLSKLLAYTFRILIRIKRILKFSTIIHIETYDSAIYNVALFNISYEGFFERSFLKNPLGALSHAPSL